MKAASSLRWLFGALAGICVVACGPEAEPDPPGGSSPPSHDGCVRVAADVELGPRGVTETPTASYGKAGCSRSFVVDLSGLYDPRFDPAQYLEMRNEEPQTEAEGTGCGTKWLKATIWRKQGSGYVKLADVQRHSEWKTNPVSLRRYCGLDSIRFDKDQLGQGGELRIAASAGSTRTGQHAVSVKHVDPHRDYCAAESEFGEPCDFHAEPRCTHGIVPITPGIKGCFLGPLNQTECISPNPFDDGNPCRTCGTRGSGTVDCGACEGSPCAADDPCAPGYRCGASQLCEPIPGCTLRAGLCWEDSFTGDYGVDESDICEG